MIFMTVGTQFPFDRLVKSFDQVVSLNLLKEDIFAQIGCSDYKPRNFEAVSFLEKSLFDKHIRQASYVISHAGMGTICATIEHHKPLLVMPRRQVYNEVVNDHQLAIARKFEQLGHILVAYKAEDLAKKISQLKTFVPHKRQGQSQAVIERITQFLITTDKINSGRIK